MSRHGEGRIRVHFDVNTGLILGAGAFGHHAAEALSMIQLAINTGITWEQLTRTPYPHPSLAEVWGGK